MSTVKVIKSSESKVRKSNYGSTPNLVIDLNSVNLLSLETSK